MDLDKLTLFGLVKGRMGWLSKRQEVLAHNVANSDTPEYKPRDLKPFDFKEIMRRQKAADVMGMSGRAPGHATHENRTPYETAPAGNAVVLEEQMGKIGETQLQYQLTNELYRKHIGMIKIALGKGR